MKSLVVGMKIAVRVTTVYVGSVCKNKRGIDFHSKRLSCNLIKIILFFKT